VSWIEPLGLNTDAPLRALEPEPRHKSAGLAFGLSVLLPGAGQLYCGKVFRGGMTLGFWLVCVLFWFTGVNELIGLGLICSVVLWVFSFLDAYFTAIEINRGQDDHVDASNPRVAVTLNLLTAGFGYFYLGEQSKGIALFMVTLISRLIGARIGGIAGGFVAVALTVVQVAMAVDAYRIARRQVKESLGPEATQLAASAPAASRLPVHVPVAVAGLVGFGFIVLAVIGLALGPTLTGKRTTAANRARRPTGPRPAFPTPPVNPYAAPDALLVPAVDLASAVQNVQQVQRKPARLKKADIPNLRQDVRVLTSVLGARKIDAADAVVAHYFRGVALALINNVQHRDGDAIDAAGAHQALADMGKVIAGGRNTARTYVPAVSVSNAQYWAGIIARNHLRDQKAAYSYWEECAGEGHGGCMHNVAGAHITGDGGEKVDLHAALDLHTIVFKSGVKYRCAGALSAMSIAYINYFTGVRRPDDDELEWMQKGDALLDQLQARENNRNVCSRADAEVDEFLLQLSHGHRDDNILQDAISRLNDDTDSKTTMAVVQFISGAIDEAGLEAAVQADKSQGARCSAYFDAMWYAELRKEDAMARRYHQHLVDIGKFDCGQHLVYSSKFKL
jgi:TM2 domain-containing membrane protein YozV